MPATKLSMHRVDKPWGRHDLWPGFQNPEPDADPVGEIWFQQPGDAAPDLLIKYLFTSEKLSVQVHPDDDQAAARDLPRGKDECWLVLAAEPGSSIALGTREVMDKNRLREAARDGSIEHLLDWKPATAGDFFYSPAGTIHAIGPGLTLIEVQQNSETTYRLYDYGRPRALHLDAAVDVADLRPYRARQSAGEVEPGRELLIDGPKFMVERWSAGSRHLTLPDGMTGWLIPISGNATADDLALKAGDCAAVTGTLQVEVPMGGDLLCTYPGSQRLRISAQPDR